MPTPPIHPGPDAPIQEETILLEGVISITAALEAGHRPVMSILLDRNRPHRFRANVERLARRFDVPLEPVDPQAIDAMASGRSHGGVVAFAGPRRFAPLDQLDRGRTDPFLVFLDGFEDPYTFGHAVRALYAAGVDGLILRQRWWESAASTICRSSAGASERLPTTMVEDPLAAISELRQRSFRVVCATEAIRATPLDVMAVQGPILLVLGGEKRGIGRAIREMADSHVRIPYARSFGASLTLSTAAAVLAFEIARHRAEVTP